MAFQVSIVKQTDPLRAAREAVDLLGGMASVVDANDTVLIKPNCIIQKYVEGRPRREWGPSAEPRSR